MWTIDRLQEYFEATYDTYLYEIPSHWYGEECIMIDGSYSDDFHADDSNWYGVTEFAVTHVHRPDKMINKAQFDKDIPFLRYNGSIKQGEYITDEYLIQINL
jgi:hypothetical protein